MAYLCGGTNAVIRTVLYAVYRRRLVLAAPVSWFGGSRIVTKPDLSGRTLTGLEERVLKAIRRPTAPLRLFRDEALACRLAATPSRQGGPNADNSDLKHQNTTILAVAFEASKSFRRR
jgi:hypothetical protein